MKAQQILSTIILTCILAISSLAFLCTMPMKTAHEHCGGGSAIAAMAAGGMTSNDCVGTHFSTYLEASLAVFEKQMYTLLLVAIVSLFGAAFWLLHRNVAEQLFALGNKLYQQYKRYWYFVVPLHRINELSWLTVIERKAVASVA